MAYGPGGAAPVTVGRPVPSRRGALAATLALTGLPLLGRGVPARGSEPDIARSPWLTLPPTPGLPPGARTGTVSIDGTPLFFAELGAGDPVLFLHGGLGSSDHWGRQAADLAATHRVILPDTRGHGRSPVTGGRLGFARFASDVEGLLDHLGLPAAAIVGWSDGGVTGLHLAMTRPQRVRRLFAFGANARPDGLIPGGARAPVFAAYAARCRADYARLSPAPERWPDLVAGLRRMWRAEPDFSRGALGRIAVPVTIAAARHDELIKAEHAAWIAGTIPGATMVPLTGVSHFAMLQDPAGFTAALRAFLAD